MEYILYSSTDLAMMFFVDWTDAGLELYENLELKN